MDFLIGGLSGAGATIFTNPIDVIKTCLQLQGELRGRHEQKLRYKNVFHAMYVIAKTDGIMALQKGLVPAMILGLTMNSVRLGTYRIAESRGWTKNKKGDVGIIKAMFWASLSGALGGISGNPASVLKTRIQSAAHPTIAVGKQHEYKGTIDGCIKIYKREGLKGFFAGVNATCARLAIGGGAQLTSFSATKEALKHIDVFANSHFALACAASIVSGAVISLTICPFDVVAVRLYNQGSAGKTGHLYAGVLDCINKIYKTEGLHGFYKGLGPLYLRLAPHTTISLVMWEMLNNLLTENKRNKTYAFLFINDTIF